MKDLVDYQYPVDLGVLTIASSGNSEYYDTLKKQGVITEDYPTLLNNMVTNTGLHRVISIPGDKGLEISNVAEEANQIKSYLGEYYTLKYGQNSENTEENNGENVEENAEEQNN